ncbi:hypothetical protein BIY29_05430 [Brenneria alni]|uniref:Uncharacterized protein n=1 Tax=Brenneria alni TaxID=71656 RepID=A0A421DQZ8_9GAMM|nr:prophage tail fiber N-terminal domain-containing protein [Brenneria alni]RLM26501.1 hypothetical protein BIY29_05430 [Brenneria alni]
MSVLISGILINPAGQPVANAEITFSALTNGPSVLNGFSVSATTNQDGSYSIPLEICEYSISIQSGGHNTLYGSVSVNENTEPATINELLEQQVLEQAVTPSIIVYFRDIQTEVAAKLATMQNLDNSAQTSAATATEAKNTAAQYAQNLGAAVTAAQNASASATADANTAMAAKTAAEAAAANAQNTLLGAVTVDTAQTIAGQKVFTQNVTVARTDGQSGVAIGRTDGTTGTPYVDFYSTGVAVYGARLIASGGTTSTVGTGTLNVVAGSFTLNGIAVATSGTAVMLDGSQTITGAKTFSAESFQLLGTTGSQKLKIGRVDGVASSPHIDFNSGTTVVDRDARIQCTGGSGANNGGTLNLLAGSVLANSSPIVTSGVAQTIAGDKTFTSNVRVEVASYPGVELTATNIAAGTVGRWKGVYVDNATQMRIYCRSDRGDSTGQITLAIPLDTTTSVATLTRTETLTNKSLTSPNLTGSPKINGSGIVADTNGFWKTASPIIKLFSDGSIETNDEAAGVTAEKIGIGEYRISGCLGFNSDPAWGGIDGGIEIPLDINKQPLIWADTSIEADGSIIISTYHRTHPDAPEFARNNIDGVENGQPIDIPASRWIDVRVQMPELETSATDDALPVN